MKQRTFADNLRKLMRERGLTAYALAKASGVPQTTIYGILSRNGLNSRIDTAQKLAKALGVKWAQLYDFS